MYTPTHIYGDLHMRRVRYRVEANTLNFSVFVLFGSFNIG